MATTSNWKKHLKHEGSSVINHLTMLEEGKDNDEHIHQIRVHIKKMNAILYLLGEEELSSIILQKGFKKVFSICGEIRNHQIILEIITLHALADKKLKLELSQNIARGIKTLVQLKTALIIKLEHSLKLGLSHVKKVPGKLILSSYQLITADLFLLMANPKTNKDLHGARKKIKNLVYPAAFLGGKHEKIYKPFIESLTLLQDQIGKWHDLFVTLEYVNKSGSQKSKGVMLLAANEKKSRKELIIGIKKLTSSFSAHQ